MPYLSVSEAQEIVREGGAVTALLAMNDQLSRADELIIELYEEIAEMRGPCDDDDLVEVGRRDARRAFGWEVDA